MAPTTSGVAVTYTGRETPFIERNYGSALIFEPGQSRTVPSELAEKLLRHADVFEPGLAAARKPEKSEGDDTQDLLDQAAALQSEKSIESNLRQDLVDQINAMDKDALKDYATVKYRQSLPKTLSVENMRAKVVGLIDQYGAV